MRFLLTTWMYAAAVVGAAAEAPSSADSSAGIEIDQVQITCRIDGRQLAVTTGFEAKTKQPSCRMRLIQGDVVLEKLDPSLAGMPLAYDPNDRAYYVTWPEPGRHRVDATFMAQSVTEPNGPWRRASLQVPGGRVRQIRLVASQGDLEVELPGALRVERHVDQGQLIVEALLGPREPLTIRWKPQVQLADAKLVLSSRATTVVDVRAGLVQIDALFDFEVAQGRIESLTFNVPAGLSVTGVQGSFIRTWVLGDAADAVRPLRVELSRAQDRDYCLLIHAESGIGGLPSLVEVPAIEPTGDIRASGHLAVGTNSALQLVVQESSGLTQVDAAAFPRVQTQEAQVRPLPQGKAFFYTYAGSHYRLRLRVDDIVPTYEVAGRVTARVKEDDLVVDAELELDVRDAPVRQLEIAAPAGLVVAAVDGNQVSDYHVPESSAGGASAPVRVVFKEPVIGRALLHLRLELGRGPLGEPCRIPALRVVGAKTQRGYVVIAAEPGIEIDPPQVQNLREVHTASVPMRVAQAQYAYRFREADWTLNLLARRKPAEVRAEVFHLQSIGEALAYGSAVINYVITGSPLDELSFRLPESFENVEFVGRDVRRWVRQDGVWVAKLTRKVLGDYSLAVTYTQRHGPGKPIQLGALVADGVQTQTGYVVVTSHLDLRLQLTSDQPAGQAGLLPIALDELPSDYRLLTSSPILAAYKYVAEPHTAMLTIDPYERSELLPVVVDIADLQTKLAIRPDGRIESVTTVRYKVKNATGQFLALTMPADARVWSVSQVEPAREERGRDTLATEERSIRLAASHDRDSGRLLVPLRRQANPNDPATIELEYGQVHQSDSLWTRTVDLTAPRCAVPNAYADWQIIVPDRWAILPAGGNMQAQPRPQARPGLAELADRVIRLWERALEHMVENDAFLVFGAAAAILVVVAAIFRRRWMPELIVLAALLLAAAVGIVAATGRLALPEPLTSLSCTQAVSVDASHALGVSVKLVPAWRQAVRLSDCVGVAVVVIVALALALASRRLRKAGLLAIAVALVYLAAKVPVTWPVLAALGTWGLPAIAAVWFAYRSWRVRPAAVRALAVTLILIVVCMTGGCSALDLGSRSLAGRSGIERVECSLSAGSDNMELRYDMRIVADRPSRFPIVDESAVLVSSARCGAHVSLRTENGQHVVQVDRPGTYDVEAVFLAPLPAAGEDQQRRFELALPLALTNRVTLAVPDANVLVEAPQAVLLTSRQREGQTQVEAMFAPGRPVVFAWRPLERQAAREEVRFYAQDVALASATAGLLQVFHEVRLQIAQGQVDRLTLDVPPGQTVTSVSGPQVGAWRFDLVGHRLDVLLSQPVTGSYAVTLVMQSANAAVPYDVRLEPLVVQQAQEQHSVMGLAAEPSVYVQLERHPPAMNVQDYVREAGKLVKIVPGLAVEQIDQAFRFESPGSAVTGRVQAVPSEIRSQESARFNVEDDRLVYNSQWEIEIAKAGRFDVDLLMPDDFDIDALEAQEVSHWDESTEAGQRRVKIHFKHRLTGSVRLNVALSRAIADIPDRLFAPRVTVVGGLKHAGYLVIGSEQGVRVSVASRQGVSEINPVELGHAGQGLLAFQFLRPDWQLQLVTERIQARVTVQSLHVAKVTDGLVRHEHALRYRLYHAGTKAFALALPLEAVGVTITGPGIARREQSGPGQWRVELADKVYDRPYLMHVSYETRYDPTDGNVPLAPARCLDADLQQGYTAVFATDRMELAVASVDAALRPADARSVPDYFGAGDLSGAAMCFRSASVETQNLASLRVRARRHAAADQIGAEVLKTDVVSVVTTGGGTINRVVLRLRVGSQRHLQTILPAGAAIWSVTVDGQAVQPSVRTTADGHSALLVPLPQQASDDVQMDMVYVGDISPSSSLSRSGFSWPGRHALSGPRFDLPLKNITWQVYLPQNFTYSDFGGTIAVDPRGIEAAGVLRYDLQTYQRQILEVNRQNELVAQQQQSLARDLAQRGQQAAARQALTKGYNFSVSNMALNEDIRVDLDNLVRQQAKAGLINARGRLRQQMGLEGVGDQGSGVGNLTPDLSAQQVQRVETQDLASLLPQADSENLELITRRILQTQAAAQASVSQIQVTMPVCGQVWRFDSPLQVEPASEMAVTFTARPQRWARMDPSLAYGPALFAGLLACGAILARIRTTWDRLARGRAQASSLPISAGRDARFCVSTGLPPTSPDNRDDPNNSRISTDELL
ncbi:MAG: hypothetical protein JW955_12445 [Sedimentisphaerales bacterium]|nr:hypothetical protein [Sedimentisphaerales bacterium]